MNHRVDVVIVNYHSANDIAEGLDTLGHWPHGRIWLVDNNGDDSERDAFTTLAAKRPEVSLLRPSENLGFGQGCNLAWAHSDATHVLLLNPDARLSRVDAEALHAALVNDKALGAVSPATYWNSERTFVLPRPSTQSALAHMGMVVATWAPWLTRRMATHLTDKTRMTMAPQPDVHRVGSLAGAVLMLNRAAVEAAGGLFDPRFFMFFEDADLSIRLRRAGYGLGLLPQAQAEHTYRHQPFKAALMTQSQRAYFQKNHPIYWALSRKLRVPERWARALNSDRWRASIGPQRSANAFNEACGGQGVWAFSPSMQMFPAIVRPANMEARPWTEAEWSLLEPGPYVALVAVGTRRVWMQFEKAK